MNNLTGLQRWLAVLITVLGVQLAPVSAFAATPENHPVPSAENLPQALAIIEQTSRNSDVTFGKSDPSFSGRLKQFKRKYSPDPKFTFKVERGKRDSVLRFEAKKKSGINYGRNSDRPELGTFYDRKGRLRKWVRDPAAPGGVRVLESPPMEALRKLTGGFIDWGFEKDSVLIDFDDLPMVSKKPVQEQTYLERKNAKKRFVTKMGLSLSMPHPIEVGKLYYLRGKFAGEDVTLVKVSRWVDGNFAGDEEIYGKNFSIPLKFSESGNHSLKVVTLDTEGNTRTRFIQFPVGFTMSVDTNSGATDGGRLALKISIKGSDGPFKATFTTSDGRKFETNTSAAGGRLNDITTKILNGALIVQFIPNPGQNTVKWVDVVVQDIKAGYVVSRRAKLMDVPIVANLTASKTNLAPEEKTFLSVDIEGGEPFFRLVLFVDGQSRQGKVAKDRKGRFSIKFDEPGTYSVYVAVGSKNIAGKKISVKTKPLVLTVTEPEEDTVAAENTISILTGAVEPFNVSRTGYKWLGLPGRMNGTVTISIAGSTASAKITYEANDLIYTDFTGVASGEISGYLTRQGKLVLAGRIPFRANDLSGCERTNSSGDQRTCQGTVVVWIKGQRVGNRLEGSWQFDRKHNGKWQTSPISEAFLTPDEIEAFDDESAKSINKFKADVANSNEYELFKDALLEYFD